MLPVPNQNGDLYIGGHWDHYRGNPSGRMARVDKTGSPVASFNVGSGFDNWGGVTEVNDIISAPDNSGDIYVGGDFDRDNAGLVNRLVRLRPDGTRDAQFQIGSGFNARVNTMLFLPSDPTHVYVGGAFTSYNGSTTNYITRLNRTGGF